MCTHKKKQRTWHKKHSHVFAAAWGKNNPEKAVGLFSSNTQIHLRDLKDTQGKMH
jgi:hypothetical protein